MFTVKLIKHGGKAYKSFPVISYSVDRSTETRIEMELPNGDLQSEEISPSSPWSIAYITNQHGRTIDTLRMK